MADPKYQTKVYMEQGAETIVVADGGELKVEDGGTLTVEDGFEFFLGSTSTAAALTDLVNSLYAYNRAQVHVAASASTNPGVLIPSTILTNKKIHLITPGSNAVANTLWLISAPSVGQELILLIDTPTASANNLGQSTAVTISCDAGLIIPAVTLVSNSRMILYASSNSRGYVHLTCAKDGEWSVISISSTTAVTFT